MNQAVLSNKGPPRNPVFSLRFGIAKGSIKSISIVVVEMRVISPDENSDCRQHLSA